MQNQTVRTTITLPEVRSHFGKNGSAIAFWGKDGSAIAFGRKMEVQSLILKLHSLIGKYGNTNPKTLITVIAWNPRTKARSA